MTSAGRGEMSFSAESPAVSETKFIDPPNGKESIEGEDGDGESKPLIKSDEDEETERKKGAKM